MEWRQEGKGIGIPRFTRYRLLFVQALEIVFLEEWNVKMPAISREAGLIGSEWGQALLQSDTFNEKLKGLIQKHDLEGLNKE